MKGYSYSAEELQALLPWAGAAVPLLPDAGDQAMDSVARTQERVRGMLLGLAIGDALGNTTENLTPAQRRRAFGEIRDYLPNRREDLLAVGLPSGDTQLSFWTLESLLRHGYLDPVDLADSFTRQDRIFGIGEGQTAFILSYRFGGKKWFEAGKPSANNAALMRMAPILLPHLRTIGDGLWRDVVAATVLTNRDEAAIVGSIGLVGVLAECLAREEGIPDGRWWPETFIEYARPVETDARYGSGFLGDAFNGSLSERVEQTVLPALASGMTVAEAAERWRSGAGLLESVPCILLVLALHSGDPETAVVRAVNDTRDNDTIASIVGSVVGALHGEAAFPERWRQGLLGRTREEDDGHVQHLIETAVDTFVG